MSVGPLANRPDTSRSLLALLLIGIGVMAAIDEIVFHQILAWHHLYDQATPAMALLSDGLLHAAELLLVVAGFVLLGDLRQRRVFTPRHAAAGLFLGLGGFQLFDGIITHKVLRLHQVRDVDNLLPYDLAWNGAGLVLLVIGLVLVSRARAETSNMGASTDR